MAILRVMIWILLFLLATFSWVVVFEHGPSGFSSGWGEEWRNLRRFLGSDEASP